MIFFSITLSIVDRKYAQFVKNSSFKCEYYKKDKNPDKESYFGRWDYLF